MLKTKIFFLLGGSKMIKTTQLSKELIEGGEKLHPFEAEVRKRTLEGVDEIQHLYVTPWTSIKKHGHDGQWEIWIRISHKVAYVCLKGEEHELINNSGSMMILMAIKGHINYSYDDLADFLRGWGFSVTQGSLVVND